MMAWLPLAAQGFYLGALAVMAGINVYAAPRIATERVPMQWNLSGDPTWYASKPVGLWFTVAVMTIVGGSLLLKVRQPESGVGDWLTVIGVGAFVAAVHVWHVFKVIAWAAEQP